MLTTLKGSNNEKLQHTNYASINDYLLIWL
jgi:hypothetical protein